MKTEFENDGVSEITNIDAWAEKGLQLAIDIKARCDANNDPLPYRVQFKHDPLCACLKRGEDWPEPAPLEQCFCKKVWIKEFGVAANSRYDQQQW